MSTHVSTSFFLHFTHNPTSTTTPCNYSSDKIMIYMLRNSCCFSQRCKVILFFSSVTLLHTPRSLECLTYSKHVSSVRRGNEDKKKIAKEGNCSTKRLKESPQEREFMHFERFIVASVHAFKCLILIAVYFQ